MLGGMYTAPYITTLRKRIAMEILKLGESLPCDVYKGNLLLVRQGTIITEALIRTLENFGVTLGHKVPKYRFQDFSDSVRLGLLKLDLDAVVDCARGMVEDLIDNRFAHALHLVYDYDKCTFTHSRNVALLSIVVGMEVGYSVDELKTIAVGALLHDIGKLQVPLDILNKPGRLTREEYTIMQRHPQLGYDLLKDYHGVTTAVKQIILQHHENYDGSGYPRKLTSFDGYKVAGLVHLCDVYEAMCSVRPYKDQIPRDIVRDYIHKNSGKMFNPVYVDKFLASVPSYLIGEEIPLNEASGIVLTCEDDPLIQCCGGVYRLSQFDLTSKQYRKVT